MPDFPKFADMFRVFRDEAVGRSTRLTLNAVDRDGSDSNILGAAAAVVGEEAVATLASVEEGFWLDSARGRKLDRLAWDRYQMLRKPASPAFVYLRFTTSAPAGSAFAIPSNVNARTADGREFVTVAGTTFPAGSSGPVDVLARSTLAGLDQNVGPGTVTSLVTQIAGSPVGLTVSNPESAVGGAAEEDDIPFKERIRQFWLNARRGVKTAIEAGALAIPGVRKATAFEGLTGPAWPNRMVSLVITDEFTDALVKQGVAVPTYEARSQAFAKVVQIGLDEWRGWGIPVFVTVAQVALVSVILRLRFQATEVLNIDYLSLLARAQVVSFINQLPPGATLDPVDLVTVLRALPGLDIRGDEIISPAGLVVPVSPYQVLRSYMGIVTVDSQATLGSIAPSFVA